ncbi:MAG: hypothetical protein ACR2QG_00730 [Gammaproteobacteria bacterium]
MLSTRTKKPGSFFMMLVVLFVVSACATTPQAEPKGVAQLAQERWDTLLSGDLGAAYEYLSPGYRSSVNSMQYQRKVLLQKVRWTGAEFVSSDCLESTCKVQISLDFSLIGVLPGVRRFDGNQSVEENWIKSEGRWWFVPEK